MNNILKWHGKIKLLSPMSHNSDESFGVDTTFRRVKILSGGKVHRIPIYSGNAFRGILRRIGADHLFKTVDINNVPQKLYYCFFSGGMLQGGSGSKGVEIQKKREVRAMVPFLSIFGSAMSNYIMPGKLKVGQGIPICKETAEYTGIESEETYYSFIDSIFYTRRDDYEPTIEENDKKKENEDQAHQMKYNAEVLIPGTELDHTFSLTYANELEQSCFGSIMRQFINNPILGGKSAVGHGNVKLVGYGNFPDPTVYQNFLVENKESIVKYITEIL